MVNYQQPMSPEDLVVAMRIAKASNIHSDDSGLSNAEKWDQVAHILKADDVSIDVDYEVEYAGADADRCRASWFLADIRQQCLRYTIDNVSDAETRLSLHTIWLLNKQWTVRLRDRAIGFRASEDMRTELLV